MHGMLCRVLSGCSVVKPLSKSCAVVRFVQRLNTRSTLEDQRWGLIYLFLWFLVVLFFFFLMGDVNSSRGTRGRDLPLNSDLVALSHVEDYVVVRHLLTSTDTDVQGFTLPLRWSLTWPWHTAKETESIWTGSRTNPLPAPSPLSPPNSNTDTHTKPTLTSLSSFIPTWRL